MENNLLQQSLSRWTKDFENVEILGLSAFIKLNNDIRIKISFRTEGNDFPAIVCQAIDKNMGLIDTTPMYFVHILGRKKISNHPSFAEKGVSPHIWKDGLKYSWYCYTPTEADHESIADSIKNYAEMFGE